MQVNSLDYNQQTKSLSESEPIMVVCAADEHYAMPLTVMAYSMLSNLQTERQVCLYIIDGGIKNHTKQKILKSLNFTNCQIRFVSIPDALLKEIEEVHKPMQSEEIGLKADYVSIASFYRLLIPELLPKEVDKVIYLDCDLVVKGDLEQLWQAEIGENYILAVRDTWIPFVSSSKAQLNYKKLEIDPDCEYFNAGVLAINLKKWRDDEITAKAINYFKQNLEYIGWYDQGVLNSLLANQWGKLNPQWNFNATSFYDYSSQDYFAWQDSGSLLSENNYNRLIDNPYIIHFVSAKKPWTSRHCPRKESFFEYVDMTAWSGWKLTIWRRLWRRLISELKTAMRK